MLNLILLLVRLVICNLLDVVDFIIVFDIMWYFSILVRVCVLFERYDSVVVGSCLNVWFVGVKMVNFFGKDNFVKINLF